MTILTKSTAQRIMARDKLVNGLCQRTELQSTAEA